MEVIDGGKADNQAPTPDQDPEYEITVMVKKSTLEAILNDQAAWQNFWRNTIPEEQFRAAQALQGFALNGFKPITDNNEMRAAGRRLKELNAPLPKLVIAPATTKLPPMQVGKKRPRLN